MARVKRTTTKGEQIKSTSTETTELGDISKLPCKHVCSHDQQRPSAAEMKIAVSAIMVKLVRRLRIIPNRWNKGETERTENDRTGKANTTVLRPRTSLPLAKESRR